MSSHRQSLGRVQRGMALVSSLLLLVIITLLALSMFRSFSTQEKLAGNIREKERALHTATSAQQYAEWWLTLGNNAPAKGLGAVSCTTAFTLNANNGEGQICDQNSTLPLVAGNVAQVPWNVGGATTGIQFLPTGMTLAPLIPKPSFYIGYLGVAPDASAGDLYQIDAMAYGNSLSTVAVVESVYEVSAGVTCLTC